MSTRTFTKTEKYGRPHQAEAQTTDGKVWTWTSNGTPMDLDTAARYGIPVDPESQQVARDAHLDAIVGIYRANYRGPSAEDRAEARAAHGRGVKLVNVITGTTWTT